jgi:hypothetical protein
MRLAYLIGECGDEFVAFHYGVEACGRFAPIRPMAPCNLQIGGEPHGQVREPLRRLWWKVRARLPSPLGVALLPQGLQDQLPCEIREGLRAHEKVVWRSGSGSRLASTEIHNVRSSGSRRVLSKPGNSFDINGRFSCAAAHRADRARTGAGRHSWFATSSRASDMA